MKIFKEEEKGKKSWSIKLYNNGNATNLNAVDSVTGEHLATLIGFNKTNGDVIVHADAFNAIEDQGYDATEHDNRFDESGRLEISLQ